MNTFTQHIHLHHHSKKRLLPIAHQRFSSASTAKGDVDLPVLYPGGANIPQAWATGSVFHMVRNILGLRADAPNKRLYVKPTLPDWVLELEVQQLRVSPCSLTIRFWRDGNTSRWEVQGVQADKGTAKDDIIHVVDELQK